MTDALLAYLLDDLSEARRREVEQRLQDDPQWQAELARLRQCLGDGNDPCDCAEPSTPPADLVGRTCTLVDSVSDGTIHVDDLGGVRLSEAPQQVGRSSGWTLADVGVAVGVMLILASLLLPALRASREDSRRLRCQNNLRTMGTALFDYASRNRGNLPSVDPNENTGMFAVKLASSGVMTPESLSDSLICPASQMAQQSGKRRMLVQVLSRKLDTGQTVATQIRMWPLISGNYAYRLGWFDHYGGYHQVPYTGDRYVPLMADAPNLQRRGLRSSNHGGQGYNLLTQDLSVRFKTKCTLPSCDGRSDNLFLNDRLTHAAGISKNDVVLGHSGCTPLGPLAPLSREVAARCSTTPGLMIYFNGFRMAPAE